jgi:hypothetical protein
MSEVKPRRLSARARVGFACVVAVSSWACSLLVDTNGLSGGAPPLPASDSAVGSSDAPANDAPSEGVDAASGFRDCDATPHEVCDDFDDGVLGARWSGQSVAGGGVLAFASDAGLSPPNALRSTLARTPPDGGFAAASLYKDIARAASVVDCELDIQVLAGGGFQALDVSFANAAGDTVCGIAANVADTSDGAHLREYRFAGTTYTLLHEYPLPALAARVWHHASLAATITGENTGTVKLVIDGTSLVDTSLSPKEAPSRLRLTLSENYTSTPFDALFDDVYCDIR